MKQIFIFLVVLLPFLAKSQTVIYGKYKYTDSLTFAKYKNNSTLDSVLSVDQNGRLRLAPASGLDTTSLSNRIDARVKYTDTASMLIPYLRKLDTTGKWLAVGYLPYLVKYTDTAAFLSAYYNKTVIDSKLALKLNISDTAAMLSPYARTANLPSLAPYVKYTDTSTMLSPYARTLSLGGYVPYSGATNDLNIGTHNLYANNFFDGFTNIAASGTQIVLTTASTPSYTITGSGGQTIKLPDATTLPNGAIFYFNNNQTTGAITINNNSNTLIISIPSGGFAEVYLLDNSIAAGSWDRHFQAPSNVSWSTNTFDYAGSITSATWNGVAVAVNRGGTGASTSGGALTNLGAQPQLNGTGFVKASGTTISYDNSTYLTTSSASSTYLPLGGGTMTGNLILNADPTNSLGAVTKNYVDNAITGIFWKSAVKAATTGNITLLGAQTIDGVSIVANDRVLVKNQSTATQNGIYLASTTIWTRTTDADTGGEIYGSAVFVENGGSINGGTQWTNSNTSQPTIGVDNISFSQIAGAGVYTAGTYLSLTGNVFDVNSTYSSNWNNKINPSDTATMLTPYLHSVNYGLIKSSQTVSADSSLLSTKLWRQKGIDSVSANVNLKVNISDTATMLSKYYNKTAADAKYALDVKYTDTSSMLSPYLRSLNASATYLTQTTAASTYYLQTNPAGYITSSAITGKVNYTDTATMLSAYYNKTASDAKFNLKVNISDTASMLSGYKTYYPRAALSFTAGSGAYNNSTGVITIPTNTNQLTNGAGFITGYTETDPIVKAINGIVKSNGTTISAASAGTDYQAPISLTTTGSSGASTFVSNTLNVPTYTLAGLGGQPQLNGTGFVKASGTTISYDNSTYLTGNQTITLSGDVSGSGATAITTTIGLLKVTNAMLAGTINYSKMDATTVPTWNQNTTGTATNITATSNATLTTLSSLSLPYSQLTGTPTLSYLPLAGGTLTGALGGTTATFSGIMQSSQVAIGGTAYSNVGVTLKGTINGNNDSWGIYQGAVTLAPNANSSYASNYESGGTVNTGTYTGLEYRGLYQQNITVTGTGTLSSAYGIYIASLSGATNNYSAYFGQNVGIGTVNPAQMLHVASPQPDIILDGTSTSQYSRYVFREAGAEKAVIQYVNSAYTVASRQKKLEFGNNDGFNFVTTNFNTPVFQIGSNGVGTFNNGYGALLNLVGSNQNFTTYYTATNNTSDQMQVGIVGSNYSASSYPAIVARGAYLYSPQTLGFVAESGYPIYMQTGGAINFTLANSGVATFANNVNAKTFLPAFSGSTLANKSSGIIWDNGTIGNTFGFIVNSGVWFQGDNGLNNAYFGVKSPTSNGTLGGTVFSVASNSGAVVSSSSVTAGGTVTVNSGASDATFLATTTSPYAYLMLEKSNAVSTTKRWDVMYRGDTYFGNTSNALIFLGEHASSAGTIDGYYMPLALQPNGNVIMAAGSNVLGNGNVGIGTTSPSSLLQIEQTTPILTFNQTTANSNQGIYFNGNGTNYGRILNNQSTGLMTIQNGINSGDGYAIRFITDGGERMRITSGGNVGINQTNPSMKLQVSEAGGDLSSGTAVYGSTAKGVYIDNTTNTSNNGIGVWFNHGALQAGIASMRATTGNWGTDIRFYTHPDATTNQTTMNEVARFTSAGYLGIGTMSPSYALDVVGDIRATGNLVVSGTTFGGVTTQAYGYGHIYKGYTGSTYDVMFINPGNAVDELQVIGGLNFTTTTAGVTFPRMTTTQKNALTKRAGMVVYDTTANLLQCWNGASWNNLW